jgi:hypothetical protein
MSAMGAGVAVAFAVSKAGLLENSDTQTNAAMTTSKQISTSFSMASSTVHWCADALSRFMPEEKISVGGLHVVEAQKQ